MVKKPTEKQITKIAIDYCKKFVLKEENCNNCPFYKQGACNFQRDKFVSEHLIYFAITEWEKIRGAK